MNKSAALGSLVLGWALACLGCATAPEAHSVPPVQRSFYLMGTSLDLSVSASSRERALAASEAAFRAARETERRLSTWVEDSELARVNAASKGSEVPLSPLLERDLRGAYRYARETEFAFTPWIGPLVRAWGLRIGGRIPPRRELAQARRAARPESWGWIQQGLFKNDTAAQIEEGGFGKGIGLDDAVAALKDAGVGSAVLNFGGQVSVLGPKTATIEVSDPAHRAGTLLRFEAAEGSVSTSGNSEHGMKVGARRGVRRIGHILDPWTGEPASFEGSATAYAPTGLEADCLSTAFFVMGVEKSMQWSRERAKQALWIEPAPGGAGHWVAHVSCAWQPRLEKISDHVEIRRECGST